MITIHCSFKICGFSSPLSQIIPPLGSNMVKKERKKTFIVVFLKILICLFGDIFGSEAFVTVGCN